MASEGTSTVPRMGSFSRSLFGYKRSAVDAELRTRDVREAALRRDRDAAAREAVAAEDELTSMSAMVLDREREIRNLDERLREANERHDRSIVALQSVSTKLEEIQSQARGQATRIRMKALREAVEVSRRTQDLVESGSAESALGQLFEGLIRLEIGPLGDFSQLVGIEDAVGRLGASEISVERFSEGRATLSMRLDEPVELLRELEETAPFDFQIRRSADDELVLDVDDDDGSEQRAA